MRTARPAAHVLDQIAGTVTDEVVPRVVAAWPAEAVGPTRPLPRTALRCRSDVGIPGWTTELELEIWL